MNDASQATGNKHQTDEERRFILWSIARANTKLATGPYIDGSVPDYRTFSAAENLSPTTANDVEERRMTKSCEYYRKLILAKAAMIGGLSGGLIGLNVGVLASASAQALASKLQIVACVSVLCLLLGITLAWMHVLLKRADLYGRRLALFHAFLMLWNWPSSRARAS